MYCCSFKYLSFTFSIAGRPVDLYSPVSSVMVSVNFDFRIRWPFRHICVVWLWLELTRVFYCAQLQWSASLASSSNGRGRSCLLPTCFLDGTRVPTSTLRSLVWDILCSLAVHVSCSRVTILENLVLLYSSNTTAKLFLLAFTRHCIKRLIESFRWYSMSQSQSRGRFVASPLLLNCSAPFSSI